MITKILVPVDGSETARKALKYAIDLAKQTRSSIVLLNVIDKSPYYAAQSIHTISGPTQLLENLEDYFRETAEIYLAEAERLCKKGKIKSQNMVRMGHPVEEIIKAANKSRADLIVMGSHGRSALGAAILGSVTAGVLHGEKKHPVLVVRR